MSNPPVPPPPDLDDDLDDLLEDRGRSLGLRLLALI